MSLRLAAPFLLLALCAGAFALVNAPPTPTQAAEPAVEFRRDVVYGTGGSTPLRLNLARPAGAKEALPAVLVFHGGGWVSGRKEQHDELVRFLAEEGFFAATVQYRLTRPGLKHVNPWPAQLEDARRAVRWLRTNAARWSVDAKRIAALGFSAGAHLAMLLGTMDDEAAAGEAEAAPSSRVDAVISFFGPTDMGRITNDTGAVRQLDLAERRREVRGRALGMVLGPAFRADPDAASPLCHVSPGDAPMLLVQGTRDHLVPYRDAQRMVDALTKARVDGEVVFKIGLGHGWGDPHLTDSVELCMRFLDRKLRPGRRRSVLPRLR